MSPTCCGTHLQVFRLADGADEATAAAPLPIELHRCGSCGSRAYLRGAQVLAPDVAFAALAGTFRRVDRPAKVAREAAMQRAERIAARAAARGDEPDGSPAAAPTRAASHTVDVTDLGDLLAGWTILGVPR